MILGSLFKQAESPCPKDAPDQLSMHSGQWFMRRFLKIYRNCSYFAPY